MSSKPPQYRESATMFALDPEDLAQLIASETSGIVDAKPEPDDIELAERFIELINERYNYLQPMELAWVPKTN